MHSAPTAARLPSAVYCRVAAVCCSRQRAPAAAEGGEEWSLSGALIKLGRHHDYLKMITGRLQSGDRTKPLKRSFCWPLQSDAASINLMSAARLVEEKSGKRAALVGSPCNRRACAIVGFDPDGSPALY